MSCFSKQQPRGLLAQEKAVTGLAFPGLHKALQICEPAGLSSTLLGFVVPGARWLQLLPSPPIQRAEGLGVQCVPQAA